MFYTIYKTTNKQNGKFYIGKHQTEKVDDSYLGSGKKLAEAIKKYGRDNFTKEILFVYDNEQDMNLKEKEIITEEFVFRRDTYNIGVGGEGGPQFRGRKHTKSTKKKISEAGIGQVSSEEKRKKISESNKKTNHTRGAKVSAALTGRKKSPEHIEAIRASIKKRYVDRAVMESQDPHKVS